MKGQIRKQLLLVSVLISGLGTAAYSDEFRIEGPLGHLAEVARGSLELTAEVTTRTRAENVAINQARRWGGLVLSSTKYSDPLQCVLYRDLYASREGEEKKADVIVSKCRIDIGEITIVQTGSILLMRFMPDQNGKIDTARPLEALKGIFPEKMSMSTSEGFVDVPGFRRYMEESTRVEHTKEVAGVHLFRVICGPFLSQDDSPLSGEGDPVQQVPDIATRDFFAWYRNIGGWCTPKEVVIYFAKTQPAGGMLMDFSGRFDDDWF